MSETIDPPPRGEKKVVVIIGGGAVGALIAFLLRLIGHEVILLEARAWGNGSSSRSAACIRAQFDTPSTIRGMVFCEYYYKNWPRLVGGSISPITENGYLFLKDYNTDIEALKRLVAIQQGAGLSQVEFLERAALDKKFPYLDTTGILGATWCPTDGFLSPGLVYGDAIEAAKKLGAHTYQNAEVVSVVFQDGKAVAVKTADGREFEGDIFINACGVWAPGISDLFGGHPLDIKTRRRYLYFLDGFDGKGGDYLSKAEFSKLPMTITPRGCYCRPESANSGMLMMGMLQHAAPIRPEFDTQDLIEPGFHPRDEYNYGDAVRKEITTYLPDAEKMGKFAAVTSGFYEDTPDHNPLIGYDPRVPNLIHAAGFSGHGLMHAPFTAATVAHFIAAGRDLTTINLPLVGEVNVESFKVKRIFKGGEGMVI